MMIFAMHKVSISYQYDRQPESQKPAPALLCCRLHQLIQRPARANIKNDNPEVATPPALEALPGAYRMSALMNCSIRFWVSRLLDYHFPQGGEMTFVKDPDVFRDLLLYFRQSPAPAATGQAPFNLEGKAFQPAEAGHAGETPERCRFRQDGDTVWAEYQGGGIRKGFLLGRYTDRTLIRSLRSSTKTS